MSETILAAIITGIISLVVGFWGGECYESHRTVKITQKAGKNASQTQIGKVINGDKR